ncbi:hypothetical protein D9M72_646420 [compost metagenome]
MDVVLAEAQVQRNFREVLGRYCTGRVGLGEAVFGCEVAQGLLELPKDLLGVLLLQDAHHYHQSGEAEGFVDGLG